MGRGGALGSVCWERSRPHLVNPDDTLDFGGHHDKQIETS